MTTRMPMIKHDLPVRETQCPTCPFRAAKDGGWEDVRPLLIQRALTEGTPICHSTGKALIHHGGKRLPAHLCRGARDLQLGFFHAIGFISANTDEAWATKRRELDSRTEQEVSDGQA